jgi:hypothetical protein
MSPRADELALRKARADQGGVGFWQAIRATVEPGNFNAEDFFTPLIYARLGDINNGIGFLRKFTGFFGGDSGHHFKSLECV